MRLAQPPARHRSLESGKGLTSVPCRSQGSDVLPGAVRASCLTAPAAAAPGRIGGDSQANVLPAIAELSYRMIGVIADDLTGAAELGGVGLRHGLRAEV